MSTAPADPVLREVIRLALAYRDGAGFGPKILPTALQKVLYELRERLPESSPVRARLPYYWFKAGAYSEPVTAEQEGMVADGILREEVEARGTLLVLPREYVNRRLTEHDEGLQEARALLQGISRTFSYRGLMRAQYERCAPAGFYPRFKLDYMDAAEIYYNTIARGGVGRGRATRDRLPALLSEATGSLIIDPRFSGFKRAYFDFEVAFCRVMRCDLEESDPRYQEMVGEAIELSRKVWDAFACGARLVKHDPVYDSRLEAWGSMFEREVAEMAAGVERFYFKVLERVKPYDFDERAVSIETLIEKILEYRKGGKIAYVNFNRWPKDGDAVGRLLSDGARGIPEASALTRQGQLDLTVMEELNDAQLSSVIRSCAGTEPISVAFLDEGTQFVSYRIKPSSLSIAAEAKLPH